jgi:hypothetical protein
MTFRRALPLLAIAAVVVLLIAGDASACPNCREAVAENSRTGVQGVALDGNAASGFNNAIMLSLGVVFSIVGVLGWRIAKAVAKADAS